MTSISLSIDEDVPDDEIDALEDWIGEMTQNIKKEARKRYPPSNK